MIRILLIVASAFLFAAPLASAQTSGPELLVTWKAKTFVPADYEGKAMPTGKTSFTAAVTLLNNGRVVDLSGETVYWYLNGKLIRSGRGAQRVSFAGPEAPRGSVDIRAELPNYGTGDPVLKTVEIPILPPEAVIDGRNFSSEFRRSPFSFRARPFYFNTNRSSNLSFEWKANDVPPQTGGDPEIFEVSASGAESFPVTISLIIRNPRTLFEAAEKAATYIFNP